MADNIYIHMSCGYSKWGGTFGKNNSILKKWNPVFGCSDKKTWKIKFDLKNW